MSAGNAGGSTNPGRYSHAEQDVQRSNPQITYAKVLDGMIRPKTLDALDTAVLIGNVADEAQPHRAEPGVRRAARDL